MAHVVLRLLESITDAAYEGLLLALIVFLIAIPFLHSVRSATLPDIKVDAPEQLDRAYWKNYDCKAAQEPDVGVLAA